MDQAQPANLSRRQPVAPAREAAAPRSSIAVPANGGARAASSCACGGGCPTCVATNASPADASVQREPVVDTAGAPPTDVGGAEAPAGTGYDKDKLLATMKSGQDAAQAIGLVAADPTAALDDLYAQSQYAPFWNLVERSAPHDGATKPLLKTIFENYRGGDRDLWSVKRRLLETQFGITVWKPGDANNVDDVAELDALYAAACTLDAGAVKAPNFVADHRKPVAPVATAAAPTAFNAAYGSQTPNTAVGNGSGGVLNSDEYRDKINTPGGPELKAASAYPSLPGRTTTKSAFRLSKDELLDIVVTAQGGKKTMDYLLGKGASGPEANRAHAEEALTQYMQYCQDAFETMMIDTIEA